MLRNAENASVPLLAKDNEPYSRNLDQYLGVLFFRTWLSVEGRHRYVHLVGCRKSGCHQCYGSTCFWLIQLPLLVMFELLLAFLSILLLPLSFLFTCVFNGLFGLSSRVLALGNPDKVWARRKDDASVYFRLYTELDIDTISPAEKPMTTPPCVDYKAPEIIRQVSLIASGKQEAEVRQGGKCSSVRLKVDQIVMYGDIQAKLEFPPFIRASKDTLIIRRGQSETEVFDISCAMNAGIGVHDIKVKFSRNHEEVNFVRQHSEFILHSLKVTPSDQYSLRLACDDVTVLAGKKCRIRFIIEPKAKQTLMLHVACKDMQFEQAVVLVQEGSFISDEVVVNVDEDCMFGRKSINVMEKSLNFAWSIRGLRVVPSIRRVELIGQKRENLVVGCETDPMYIKVNAPAANALEVNITSPSFVADRKIVIPQGERRSADFSLRLVDYTRSKHLSFSGQTVEPNKLNNMLITDWTCAHRFNISPEVSGIGFEFPLDNVVQQDYSKTISNRLVTNGVFPEDTLIKPIAPNIQFEPEYILIHAWETHSEEFEMTALKAGGHWVKFECVSESHQGGKPILFSYDEPITFSSGISQIALYGEVAEMDVGGQLAVFRLRTNQPTVADTELIFIPTSISTDRHSVTLKRGDYLSEPFSLSIRQTSNLKLSVTVESNIGTGNFFKSEYEITNIENLIIPIRSQTNHHSKLEGLSLENMLNEVMFLRTSMDGVDNALVSDRRHAEDTFFELHSDQVSFEPNIVCIQKGSNKSQWFQIFPKIDGKAGKVTISITHSAHGSGRVTSTDAFTIFTTASLSDSLNKHKPVTRISLWQNKGTLVAGSQQTIENSFVLDEAVITDVFLEPQGNGLIFEPPVVVVPNGSYQSQDFTVRTLPDCNEGPIKFQIHVSEHSDQANFSRNLYSVFGGILVIPDITAFKWSQNAISLADPIMLEVFPVIKNGSICVEPIIAEELAEYFSFTPSRQIIHEGQKCVEIPFQLTCHANSNPIDLRMISFKGINVRIVEGDPNVRERIYPIDSLRYDSDTAEETISHILAGKTPSQDIIEVSNYDDNLQGPRKGFDDIPTLAKKRSSIGKELQIDVLIRPGEGRFPYLINSKEMLIVLLRDFTRRYGLEKAHPKLVFKQEEVHWELTPEEVGMKEGSKIIIKLKGKELQGRVMIFETFGGKGGVWRRGDFHNLLRSMEIAYSADETSRIWQFLDFQSTDQITLKDFQKITPPDARLKDFIDVCQFILSLPDHEVSLFFNANAKRKMMYMKTVCVEVSQRNRRERLKNCRDIYDIFAVFDMYMLGKVMLPELRLGFLSSGLELSDVQINLILHEISNRKTYAYVNHFRRAWGVDVDLWSFNTKIEQMVKKFSAKEIESMQKRTHASTTTNDFIEFIARQNSSRAILYMSEDDLMSSRTELDFHKNAHIFPDAQHKHIKHMKRFDSSFQESNTYMYSSPQTTAHSSFLEDGAGVYV